VAAGRKFCFSAAVGSGSVTEAGTLGEIVFAGSGTKLKIDGTAMSTNVISGFTSAGEIINLALRDAFDPGAGIRGNLYRLGQFRITRLFGSTP